MSADSVVRRMQALSTYYVLFIVAQLFQVILCIDAVFNRNTIQVIGLAAFNFVTLAYSIIQIVQTRTILQSALAVQLKIVLPSVNHLATQPYLIAVTAIMFVFAVTFALQAWKLYQEFGWRVFKKIGADLRMRRMFMVYQIFIMILKIDVFMLLSFSVQWLVMLFYEAEMSGDYTQVIIHSLLSVGGSTIMLVIAYIGIRCENRWAMLVFFLGDLLSIGYFVSKLVIMNPPFVTPGVTCTGELKPTECDRFDGSRNFFTLFLSVDTLLGLLTLVIAGIATRNFGRGLGQHLGFSRLKMPKRVYGQEKTATVAPAKRWSIE